MTLNEHESTISPCSSNPAPYARHTAKQRKCLMCREPFASRSIGERICEACKTTELWSSGVTEHGVLPR